MSTTNSPIVRSIVAAPTLVAEPYYSSVSPRPLTGMYTGTGYRYTGSSADASLACALAASYFSPQAPSHSLSPCPGRPVRPASCSSPLPSCQSSPSNCPCLVPVIVLVLPFPCPLSGPPRASQAHSVPARADYLSCPFLSPFVHARAYAVFPSRPPIRLPSSRSSFPSLCPHNLPGKFLRHLHALRPDASAD